MRFHEFAPKKFLKEYKINGTLVLGPNPSISKLVNAVNNARGQQLRGLVDIHSNKVYWWDAYFATHDQAAKALGIEYWSSGKDNRTFATLMENGAIEISAGEDEFAPLFLYLAQTDRNNQLEFGFFLGRFESEDFIREIAEYMS